MGQRHQIYIVEKNKDNYKALGAFHHQWCYGMTAVTNIHRLAKTIADNKLDYKGQWSNFAMSDNRLVETAVKATYGVGLDGSCSMVHNEEVYLISANKQILPSLGDNNDGCSLIIVDNDSKSIRLGFFTPGHLEGKYSENVEKNKAFSWQTYLHYYYSGHEIGLKEFKDVYQNHLDIIETLSTKFASIDQEELNKILMEDKLFRKEA